MFRFSIRELLLLTLVVAMGAGWFCHWKSMQRRNEEMARRYDGRSQYIETLKDELRLEIGRANALEKATSGDVDIKYFSGELPERLKVEPISN